MFFFHLFTGTFNPNTKSHALFSSGAYRPACNQQVAAFRRRRSTGNAPSTPAGCGNFQILAFRKIFPGGHAPALSPHGCFQYMISHMGRQVTGTLFTGEGHPGVNRPTLQPHSPGNAPNGIQSPPRRAWRGRDRCRHSLCDRKGGTCGPDPAPLAPQAYRTKNPPLLAAHRHTLRDATVARSRPLQRFSGVNGGRLGRRHATSLRWDG